MARKGKTPKEPAWRDRGAFPINTTAPTTLCTEHVANEERPLECAKCGKPIGTQQRFRDKTDEWEERIDAARASESRSEPDTSALDSFLTEDEKQAPYAAVLTAEQLDAVLDAPEPAGFAGMVEVSKLWLDRAKTMADADGFTVPEFIERLIKRQWVASGAKGRG